MNWLEMIYESVCVIVKANPNEKIIIEISPLMKDYLHWRLVESDLFMKKGYEERNKKFDGLPMIGYLYGHELRVVDSPDVPTYRVICEEFAHKAVMGV